MLPRRTFEALDGDDRLAEVEADDGPALGAGGEALRRMVVRHRRRDQRQRGREPRKWNSRGAPQPP